MRTEKKNATLTCRIAGGQKERVERYCKVRDIKVSDFLRDLLSATFSAMGNDLDGSPTRQRKCQTPVPPHAESR